MGEVNNFFAPWFLTYIGISLSSVVCFIRQFTCCGKNHAMKLERWKRVFRGEDIEMTSRKHDISMVGEDLIRGEDGFERESYSLHGQLLTDLTEEKENETIQFEDE